MHAVVGGLSSRSYGASVHPTEVEGLLLRMWSSAVSSSLQMSAPQKALYQPSQASGPQHHSAKHGRSLLTEIVRVEINTGQVMYTSCMIMIIIQSKL